MSNFIIKDFPIKVDPKVPESDPSYKRAVNAGLKNIREGKLKFDSKGEEEHYWKVNRSNPNNVPGLPNFYPPLGLPKIAGFGSGHPTEELPCGHRWVHKRYDPTIMYRCSFGHEYDGNFNKLT